MAIFRVNKTKDYTVMSNYHLEDKNLTLKAKGLLSQMLSLPETWNYTIPGLVAINKEKETSIKNALDELKENRYLVVTKLYPNQTNSGRYEYIYDIYEYPKQEVEKQGLENLGVENLDIENIGLNKILNNKNTNNKILNNKEIYSEVIDYLNTTTNKHYKYTDSTIKLIKARLNEGFTVEDFKKVIDKKTKDWKNDSKMKDYLRPQTLFGTKFEGYLNQGDKKMSGFMGYMEEFYGKENNS